MANWCSVLDWYGQNRKGLSPKTWKINPKKSNCVAFHKCIRCCSRCGVLDGDYWHKSGANKWFAEYGSHCFEGVQQSQLSEWLLYKEILGHWQSSERRHMSLCPLAISLICTSM